MPSRLSRSDYGLPGPDGRSALALLLVAARRRQPRYGMGVVSTYWDEEVHRVTEIVKGTCPVHGRDDSGLRAQRSGIIEVPGYKGQTRPITCVAARLLF